MSYSNISRRKRGSSLTSKIEEFEKKVSDAKSLLSSTDKISNSEKELLSMSIDTLNDFIQEHYKK